MILVIAGPPCSGKSTLAFGVSHKQLGSKGQTELSPFFFSMGVLFKRLRAAEEGFLAAVLTGQHLVIKTAA